MGLEKANNLLFAFKLMNFQIQPMACADTSDLYMGSYSVHKIAKYFFDLSHSLFISHIKT